MAEAGATAVLIQSYLGSKLEGEGGVCFEGDLARPLGRDHDAGASRYKYMSWRLTHRADWQFWPELR